VADCDFDHYLVVANVKEKIAVNKQRSQSFHVNSIWNREELPDQ
jgi:hypothetical protein